MRKLVVLTVVMSLSASLGGTALAIKGGNSLDTEPFASACSLKITLPADAVETTPENEGIRYCSCVLVDTQIVITAAQCVVAAVKDSETQVRIAAAQIDLRFGQSFTGASPVAIDDITLHRYFDPDQAGSRDIALFHLATAPGAPIAVLNTTPLTQDHVGTGVTCTDSETEGCATIVGYGESADKLSDYGSRRRLVTAINTVASEHILAGTEESTSCDGDGGGPIFAYIGGELTLVAITSQQQRCNANVKRTRVDVFMDQFIKAYIDRYTGNCPHDEAEECSETGADGMPCTSPDPDCPCNWSGTEDKCTAECDTRDWDCPIGKYAGETCVMSGECEEGGRCGVARDNEALHFCTRPCDSTQSGQCPSDMECLASADDAGDECVLKLPSRGSQGWGCTAASECVSGICEETICVDECDPGEPCDDTTYTCLPSQSAPGKHACLGEVLSGGGGFCAIAPAGTEAVSSAATRFGALALLALVALLGLVVIRRRRGA